MSLSAMSAALSLPAKLNATQNAVLLALCWYSQDHQTAWPSNAAIRRFTRLSERSIRSAIRDLEDLGLISTERNEGGVSTFRFRFCSQPTPAGDAGVDSGETPAAGAGGGAYPAPLTPAFPAAPPADAASPPASPAPYLYTTTTYPLSLVANSAVALPALTQVATAAAPPAEPASPKKGEARGSRLPEDWQPNAREEAYARDRGLDPQRVAEDFRDYWLAKPGKDGRALDWSRTWMRWCRKQEDHNKRRSPAPVPLFDSAPQKLPEEINGWNIQGVVDHCGKLMGVDPEGFWPGFSGVIAEVLAAEADPDPRVTIYPIAEDAVRKGVRTIRKAGWFRYKMLTLAKGVAA